MGGAADLHNVHPTVGVHVGYRTSRSGHPKMVEHFVMPIGPGVVLGVEDVRACDLAPGAIAGDDIIAAVAVEVTYAKH